jgi:hypothetical protein
VNSYIENLKKDIAILKDLKKYFVSKSCTLTNIINKGLERVKNVKYGHEEQETSCFLTWM